MTRMRIAASSVLSFLFLACSSPTVPGSSSTLDGFVEALRQQGLTVTLAGQIAPSVNGFFSVPAEQVRVSDSQVNAFVYRTAAAAAAEAALISKDGQPSPTARVLWVSTPRFYRHEAMIVLYVGCATEIVDALQKTVGPPIAVGPTTCNVAN
jgi:hypothetical protein